MAKHATVLIPAVAYLRKSTNEEGAEKSIADQRERIHRLVPPIAGARYEIVNIYDEDLGVPGWKRGAKRPDYFRLVNELSQTGAKAILVDDMDRFSRADIGEVVTDVQKLREIGVQYIHAVNQGCKDIVAGGQMVWVEIAMYAMAAHGYSMGLSRRIAETRAKSASKAIRTGGTAPYGYVNDGNGGLKLGDPAKVKIVRQIYKWFVNDLKSMNWIANELNDRAIPTSRGASRWYVHTVKEFLERPAYRGTFTYNRHKSGDFHIVDENFRVVGVNAYKDKDRQTWKPTTAGMFEKKNAFPAIVEPRVWDAAQKRLASFETGHRRLRENTFPLSGVLICDHCGRPMYGVNPGVRNGKRKGHRIYKCDSQWNTGAKACRQYQIREELILPEVITMLAEQIGGIQKLLQAPPIELVHPEKMNETELDGKRQRRAALARRIDVAEDRALDAPNRETAQSLFTKITAMREELARLDSELEQKQQPKTDRRDYSALCEWWENFSNRAVTVPLGNEPIDIPHAIAAFRQDPMREELAIQFDGRFVNEALHQVGTEVRLRWSTEKVELSSGKTRNKYTLIGGRFKLGQVEGDVLEPSNRRKIGRYFSKRSAGGC